VPGSNRVFHRPHALNSCSAATPVTMVSEPYLEWLGTGEAEFECLKAAIRHSIRMRMPMALLDYDVESDTGTVNGKPWVQGNVASATAEATGTAARVASKAMRVAKSARALLSLAPSGASRTQSRHHIPSARGGIAVRTQPPSVGAGGGDPLSLISQAGLGKATPRRVHGARANRTDYNVRCDWHAMGGVVHVLSGVFSHFGWSYVAVCVVSNCQHLRRNAGALGIGSSTHDVLGTADSERDDARRRFFEAMWPMLTTTSVAGTSDHGQLHVKGLLRVRSSGVRCQWSEVPVCQGCSRS